MVWVVAVRARPRAGDDPWTVLGHYDDKAEASKRADIAENGLWFYKKDPSARILRGTEAECLRAQRAMGGQVQRGYEGYGRPVRVFPLGSVPQTLGSEPQAFL